MNLLIRPAEIKNIEWISQLSDELGYPASTDQIQIRLNQILMHPDHCIYVIIDNETVIGWVHAFYTLRVESDAFVEIGGLVVAENYRRMGAGQLLVKQVMEWSQLKNCHKIRVRCNTIRKEAHAFYKRIGFIETKEQKIFDLKLHK